LTTGTTGTVTYERLNYNGDSPTVLATATSALSPNVQTLTLTPSTTTVSNGFVYFVRFVMDDGTTARGMRVAYNP
jgi:hypothetical protein